MVRSEFERKVKELGIPSDWYTLDAQFNPGYGMDMYYLEKKDDIFRVFYVERGQANQSMTFDTEDQALDHLFGLLKPEYDRWITNRRATSGGVLKSPKKILIYGLLIILAVLLVALIIK